MKQSIAIIGAGLGGLATAARLSHAGYEVEMFEATAEVGGRNKEVRIDDFSFDSGPTLLMMLDPLKRLFADLDESLGDHLDLVRCDPTYRVFFRDGTILDTTTDSSEMARRLKAIGAADDARKYPAYMERLCRLYEESIPMFVERSYRSPLDLLRISSLRCALKHGILGNLAKTVQREFTDERVRMLMSFQSMYLGLSPFEAPFVYASLAYMELGQGIFYPAGGISKITTVLETLAVDRGTKIHVNSPVAEILPKGIRLKSGEVREFDRVICNADWPYAQERLLGRNRSNKKLSCSGLVIYIAYEGELPQLEHHNVFFGSDFEQNLADIFFQQRMPDDPAFYACVSSKSDPQRAPARQSNLFVLVPISNLDRAWTEVAQHAIQDHTFRRLSEHGFDPQKIRSIKYMTPEDWQNDLNLARGAAFGIGHQFLQSAAFRPSIQDRAFPNLYYVGASTQPGNGIPMVLISAELVSEMIQGQSPRDEPKLKGN